MIDIIKIVKITLYIKFMYFVNISYSLIFPLVVHWLVGPVLYLIKVVESSRGGTVLEGLVLRKGGRIHISNKIVNTISKGTKRNSETAFVRRDLLYNKSE